MSQGIPEQLPLPWTDKPAHPYWLRAGGFGEIKDSGAREIFASGMVRDRRIGKVDYTLIRNGPMYARWAAHLTKGEVKYPDPQPGTANWTRAAGLAEHLHFKQSAAGHFEQWLAGEVDEDHAAAVFFNINGAEYTRGKP